MTDNKIFKDLECCSERGNCNRCSRYTIPYPNCKEQLCKSACNLIKRLQTENKELHNAFFNEKRIKVVQARAIKEFIEKLIYEIVNRPSLKASAGVFYMNGRVDRQNEIIDIIKEVSKEHVKSVSNRQQNNCEECQYYKEHQEYECLPFEIGDTAYCVNGYGSQRYIEEFTVAEIRITKDGIWLTDTNGMEWLARVCHFNRDSAVKELKAIKEAADIVNENFKKDVDIKLSYAREDTPQSEEIRKDLVNYIRRLKEQRGNSFFYNRFMKTE